MNLSQIKPNALLLGRQFRLNKIRAENFVGAVGKWMLKIKSLIQIICLFLRIRGIYDD